MDPRLLAPRTALRTAIGLMATLAGLDKFFNLLADWQSYVAPVAAQLMPFTPHTFMMIVGVVEFLVGITILFVRPSLGAYLASAWLVLVATNLVLGAHFDIAVRDLVLSIAAFALARMEEIDAPVAAAVPRTLGSMA